MSRKNVLTPVKISSAQSLAATFTSPVTTITYADNISYQINITTTNSTGTFSVQASLDYSPPTASVPNTGNWVDLPLGGTPSAAAANDTILINLNNLPFNATRVVYTSTVAGTGVADIYIMTKAMGA